MKRMIWFFQTLLLVLIIIFSAGSAFAEENALYPIYDPAEKAWGFIDREGQVIIEPVYDFVSPFAGEYALAGTSFPGAGIQDLPFRCVIDRKGNIAAGPVIMDYRGFNGWFELYEDHILLGNYIFLLSDGTLQRLHYQLDPPLSENPDSASDAPSDDPFSEGFRIVEVSAGDGRLRYGYADENGEMMIEPRFEEAYPFQNGLAFVVVDGDYCYIDREGSIVWSSSWLAQREKNVVQEAFSPCVGTWEDLLHGRLGGFTLGHSIIDLQKNGIPLRVYRDGIGPVDSSLRLQFRYFEPTDDDRIESITAFHFDIGGIHPGMDASQIETLIGSAPYNLPGGILFYEGITLPDDGGTVAIEFHFDENQLLSKLEIYLGW